MYGKLWFDSNFFVRNLDASVKLRWYKLLSQRNFFSLLDRVVSFLSSLGFFFFFSQGLSSAYDFSLSKDFFINKEFAPVNFVKCTM